MPTPIQIAICQAAQYVDLIVLCADGSMWQGCRGTQMGEWMWVQIPPITPYSGLDAQEASQKAAGRPPDHRPVG